MDGSIISPLSLPSLFLAVHFLQPVHPYVLSSVVGAGIFSCFVSFRFFRRLLPFVCVRLRLSVCVLLCVRWLRVSWRATPGS